MEKVKYNYDDEVSFKINIGTDELTLTGKICIIDRYGTFEQSEEPSYDILVDDYKGTQCLFKHIRQSGVFQSKKQSEWGISCDGYYPYCKNCKFEPDHMTVVKEGYPTICPKCGSEMTNAEKLNKF